NTPEDRMLPKLKDAFDARLRGEQRVALEVYQKCVDLCPDKAHVAGVRFQQGMCELELLELPQAAEYFEQAAVIEDFSQADFAAAMSALSYALMGRADALGKA